MKKTLIILVTLFLTSISFAQVRFGFKAGGNLSNLDGLDRSNLIKVK